RYDFVYTTRISQPEHYEREAATLQARINEIVRELECPCPSVYGETDRTRDEERLEELLRVRRSGLKLSTHEDLEEAWLTARVASWSTLPEWSARARLHQLDARRWDDRWTHAPPLTVREQAEFRDGVPPTSCRGDNPRGNPTRSKEWCSKDDAWDTRN